MKLITSQWHDIRTKFNWDPWIGDTDLLHTIQIHEDVIV